MVISFKDGFKFIGIIIIAFCAVFVCTMFLNFQLDLIKVKQLLTSDEAIIFYNAQLSTSKVVCAVTGGCLGATSLVMLVFYIKHYVDTHKMHLGILKALGYSDGKIAKHFWVFGISVLIGTVAGYCLAFAIMPRFYSAQNADGYLPDITLRFHFTVLLYFVILPTVLFSGFAIIYALIRLRQPALAMIRETPYAGKEKKLTAAKNSARPFLRELKFSNLKSKKVLAFFIVFSAFCFSSLTQMSLGLRDFSGTMMVVIMMLIGIVLAFTTLFLSVSTVISGNAKPIAMLRIFGYSDKECRSALLNIYRPMALIGFVLGTVYQYGLMKIMIEIVFKDVADLAEYKFDYIVMLIAFAVFAVAYELTVYLYSLRIKKLTIKEIMI
ncbi:MAG: FtsX-like permease family protein [Clostridia bacterium]|nr:FtsX-like permease family protein [Clostridia bacterium]